MLNWGDFAIIYIGIDKKIKELRVQRRLTQTQLAQMLGVSKSVVSSYENSIHLPPYDILLRLSSIFGVSCDYLLNNSNHRTLSTEGLTDTQLHAIESIIRELQQLNEKP